MWVFETALGEYFDGGAAEAGGGGELLCVDGVRVWGLGGGGWEEMRLCSFSGTSGSIRAYLKIKLVNLFLR